METSIDQNNGYTVLRVDGEVDFHCSPDLRTRILETLEAEGDLVLDLGGVSYIDSSGIASLVEGLQAAKSKEKQFMLANVQDAAMQVLKLTRLDAVFSIHASVEDAVAS